MNHTSSLVPHAHRTLGATGRGSAYLLAVIVTAILTTVGLASLSIVTRTRETANLRQGVGAAQGAIVTGVELAAHRMKNTPDWRSIYSVTPIVDSETFGSATVTVTATAVSLAPNADVNLDAQASSAGAIQRVLATLRPTKVKMTSLATALHATGDISFTNATVYADAPIHTNANMFASTSEINAPVEAVGTITGSTYARTKRGGYVRRTSPDALFIDELALSAVQIPYTSLPAGRIENVVLSPTSQPFTGMGHPDGLYAIDCGGADITIRDCRIVGTLILLNTGASSIIAKSALIEPARADYPSLLVKGSMTIRLRYMTILESDLGTNLNPPGTPYNSVSDNLIDDRYPSEIHGAVIISGTLTTRKRAVFRGSVTAGQLDCSGLLSIQHDKALERNPPAGFIDHLEYSLIPGTWKRTMR
jgi:hypothetical protein